MSRLWADRLLVSFSPDSVALVRVHGRWRMKLVSKNVIESHRPIEALRAAIAVLGKERLRATVVLSNRYVRYAVVPFDAAVSGPEEELALARFHFSRLHGDRVSGWDLRLSEGPSGFARLASAVESELLASIRSCFPSELGTRLVSVQPYLMTAYNRWRDEIAREDAWLMLPESHGACLAYATRAGWMAARVLRHEQSGDATMADGVEREQLRLAGSPRAILVHGSPSPVLAGWKLSQLLLPLLEGHVPLQDRACEMALCAQ